MKLDIYQAVTDRILELLEQGTVPWRRPIKGNGGDGFPKNLTSGKQYRGVNVLGEKQILTLEAMSYSIQWEWQSVDGAMTKSPLGGDKKLAETRPIAANWAPNGRCLLTDVVSPWASK